jgi:phospholipid/cholesterol/gamma-HCH transport system substrate-binding protein
VETLNGGELPSQRQLKWSQLRVGLTVILASLTLAVLVFLMTGATGLFVPKIKLKAYFDDASGLRMGAPVRLQGVDIGNVVAIRVVSTNKRLPVEVTMKVSMKYAFDLHKDSTATLTTAGVLGETFVNINSAQAKLPQVQDGDVLPTQAQPDLSDVVRASQTTLQNMQALLSRADRILSFVESGQGSIGNLIYDDKLYRQLNTSVTEVQRLVNQISSGEGSVGKLIMSDELYVKVNTSVDKLSRLIDDVNAGQGTVGKLIKDPALYNNANQTIAKANQLMTDVNAGKGALGKFATDEEFARKLDNTVTKLSNLADKLNSGQGSAGKFINDPAVYDNTNHLLTETRTLIKAVREQPKKYLTIHLKIF